MDALTIAAASGMRARLESLEMLANNIANQTTAGYRADREAYSLYLAPEALSETAIAPSVLPVIERPWTDYSQGLLGDTGGPLHFAIEGAGWFVVKGPFGPLYTRNGSFRLSAGGQLQTVEGYPVLGKDGKPILLDPAKAAELSPDGGIRQAGELRGELRIAAFDNPEVLEKRGGNYFRLIDPRFSWRASDARIHQGKLEGANVSPAEAAIRLVAVLRHFEMLQRAVTLGGEMNRRAVEDVARVGG